MWLLELISQFRVALPVTNKPVSTSTNFRTLKFTTSPHQWPFKKAQKSLIIYHRKRLNIAEFSRSVFSKHFIFNTKWLTSSWVQGLAPAGFFIVWRWHNCLPNSRWNVVLCRKPKMAGFLQNILKEAEMCSLWWEQESPPNPMKLKATLQWVFWSPQDTPEPNHCKFLWVFRHPKPLKNMLHLQAEKPLQSYYQ